MAGPVLDSNGQEFSSENFSYTNTESLNNVTDAETYEESVNAGQKGLSRVAKSALLKYVILALLFALLVKWGPTLAGMTPLKQVAPSLFEERLAAPDVPIPKKPEVVLPPRPKRIRPIRIGVKPQVKEKEVVKLPKVEVVPQVEVPKVEIPKVEIPKVEPKEGEKEPEVGVVKKVEELPKVEVSPKVEELPKIDPKEGEKEPELEPKEGQKVPEVDIATKAEVVPQVEVPEVEIPKIELPKVEPTEEEKEAEVGEVTKVEELPKVEPTEEGKEADVGEVTKVEELPEVEEKKEEVEEKKDEEKEVKGQWDEIIYDMPEGPQYEVKERIGFDFPGDEGFESDVEEPIFDLESRIADIEVDEGKYPFLYRNSYIRSFKANYARCKSLERLHRLSQVPEFGNVMEEMLQSLEIFAGYGEEFYKNAFPTVDRKRALFDPDEKAWKHPMARMLLEGTLFPYEDGEDRKKIVITSPNHGLSLMHSFLHDHPKTYTNIVAEIKRGQQLIKDLQERLMPLAVRWGEIMDDAKDLVKMYPELAPELESMNSIGEFLDGTIVAGFIAVDGADRLLKVWAHLESGIGWYTYAFLTKEVAAYKIAMTGTWNIPEEWRSKRKFVRNYMRHRNEYFKRLFLFFPRASNIIFIFSSMVGDLCDSF